MKLKKFKFKKVKSTNNTAIRIIKETKYNLGMVVAETQVNGRGQYGRKWISSKGNLFVSFFNEINKKKISINAITKINCILVKKLLSSFTNKKILFKKPSNFSRPIAKIKSGRVLIIQKCERNWCKIKSGKYRGWIKIDNIWGKIIQN